jgi:hypothetical protein
MTDQRIAVIDFQGVCVEKDKMIELLEHMLKREEQYTIELKNEIVELKRIAKETQDPDLRKLDCSKYGHNQESIETILHFLKLACTKDESGEIMEFIAGLITKIAQSQLGMVPKITLKRQRDYRDPLMDKRARSFLNKCCEITQSGGKLTSQDLEKPLEEFRKKNTALFTLKDVEDVLFDDANIDIKHVKGIKEYHNIKLKVKKTKKA